MINVDVLENKTTVLNPFVMILLKNERSDLFYDLVSFLFHQINNHSSNEHITLSVMFGRSLIVHIKDLF